MSTVNIEAMCLPVSNQDQRRSEEAAPPSPPKTIEDLPPEVLTKILELVTTLDGNKKNMLGCRLVNSQWKLILDSIIEKGISSGKFEAVPALYIERIDDGALKVRYPTRVADSMNPFPFKSLCIYGTHFAKPVHNYPEIPLLSLPVFASRFGGNLTTFTFRNEFDLPLNSLAGMLRSMPNLKRLSLEEVKEESGSGIREELVIPTAPLLPSLTTLEITFRHRFVFLEDVPCLLFGWLIGSYSAQLVRLHLDSRYALPPLLALHQYTYYVPEQDARPIVTTSESAFRNLKELHLINPKKEFLVVSETPALQRLSLSKNFDFLRMNNFDLGDVTVFIEKCSSTLETLNITWSHGVVLRAFTNFPNGRRQLGAAEIGFPRLKTVSISYPSTDLQELVFNTFLLQFRELKTLNLLSFRDRHFDKKLPVEEHHNSNELGNGNNQNNIAALKHQLALLNQRIREIQNNMTSASSAIARLNNLQRDELQMQDAEFDVELETLNAEKRRLEGTMAVAQIERSRIFNRLAALCDNTKKVKQLLERGGFWSTIPSLRTVTVSSGHKPDGDVCVVRRMGDA